MRVRVAELRTKPTVKAQKSPMTTSVATTAVTTMEARLRKTAPPGYLPRERRSDDQCDETEN